MSKKVTPPPDASGVSELRRRAEVKLKGKTTKPALPHAEADTKRLLHELQVHQLELEMQNSELQEARDKVEALLETYTDLYDFAPVGYFSVDEEGVIMEVNLTGAALMGIERSRLLHQPLRDFVKPSSRPVFGAFLKKIFADSGKQICEIQFLKKRSEPFWADLQAALAGSVRGSRRWCRMAISDLTELKHEEEIRQRLDMMAVANRELKSEIVRRKKVEEELKKGEAHTSRLFEQSNHMQEQLRRLSHQLLRAQEEERKRVSRELHDEIVQTLVGINVHLASLSMMVPLNLKDLRKKMVQTRRLVKNSVDSVHRFARELRPTVLDDLGLIPALQSFINEFAKRTNIRVHFTAVAEVEQLSGIQRTVLYRVAQSALANVDQHAQASEVTVSIQQCQGAIRLEVHDNGKSFEAEGVLFAKRHERLGLLGSRERVEMVGGIFGVKSSPGHGTTISAEVPTTGKSPKGTRKPSPKTKGVK
jgi:PAS domain S-box-containing protein